MNLSERQERILLSLKKLDFLNREQLTKIHRLGKKRNANRVLASLGPYLSSYREQKSTIYFLNSEGREYIDSHKIRQPNPFVGHVLMRNDFYIYSGFPHDWKNEVKIKDSKNTVICDAWFKQSGFYQFLEVDHIQKMKENRAKIEQYRGLLQNGELAGQLGYFPKLIWLTTTELRRQKLKELAQGLPCTVYTIEDIR